MNLYELNLKVDSFDRIRAEKKIYEIRLNRGKFKKMDIGDQIMFRNPNRDISVIREINGIITLPTFRELFDVIGAKDLGHPGGMEYDQWEERIRNIYSEEQEKKFGVKGIKLGRMYPFNEI